ncbi:MAG: TonB-dependent receptor [Desulfovibrionaceae bacterium]|nr:TonB-dependent receptor [Desulfovibrionaceae bacterium]MBR5734282.1 TonB-dependent receptor [Desulfovibrionaceae bacterium]
MTKKILLLALAVCMWAGTAFAGGFQLSEYSVTNQGRAFAGSGVAGDDYSAIASNPAGMTLKGSGVQLGSHLIHLHSKARGYLKTDAGDMTYPPGKLSEAVAIPFGFAQAAWEDWRFGFGVYVPYGMVTEYNEDWFGSIHALTSRVATTDFTPSVAYKLTDSFSLGASLVVRYFDAELSNDVVRGGMIRSDMRADGVNLGYKLGLMYEPVKDTRFGLSYHSKITSRIHGSHTLSGINARGYACTSLTLPEHVQLAAFHRLTDKIDLSANVRWTHWSRFKTLDIFSDIASVEPVQERWKNTWTVAAGLDYHWTDAFTLRGGVSWDQAGVPDSGHRTARVPDSNRILASIGMSYVWGNWQFDAAYTHMFAKCATASHSMTSSIYGNTEMHASYHGDYNIFGLQVQYSF